jgi:hypothetical protein
MLCNHETLLGPNKRSSILQPKIQINQRCVSRIDFENKKGGDPHVELSLIEYTTFLI